MFRPARTGVRADVKCPEPRGIRVDGQHKLSNLLSFFQVDGSAFWAVFRIDIAQRFHGSLDVVLERVMKKKGRYRSIGTSNMLIKEKQSALVAFMTADTETSKPHATGAACA
jgi:hypothetical protein